MFLTNKGTAYQLTLPKGGFYYTYHNSLYYNFALKLGLPITKVTYEGCCIASNINSRVHHPNKFPIEIDGVDIYTNQEKIVSPAQFHEFLQEFGYAKEYQSA